MGSPITFSKFRDRAIARGLEVRQCNDNHWQAKANGVTVNVWPFTGSHVKYLLQGAPSKSKVGTIDDALSLCGRHAATTPPVNGNPATRQTKEELPPRTRLVIERTDDGCFLVVSHGDAIDELNFEEMLGVVLDLFHAPRKVTRAESLFEAEKRSRFRRKLNEISF
jgi:hypothetical protein